MNDRTPNHRPNDADDEHRVERPSWITAEEWAQIHTDATQHIHRLVSDVRGTCTEHTWCTTAALPDHNDFHESEPVDFADNNAGAWLAQTRGESTRLIVDGNRDVIGGRHFEIEFDAHDAAVLLAATKADASEDPAQDARERILDLLVQVDGVAAVIGR